MIRIFSKALLMIALSIVFLQPAQSQQGNNTGGNTGGTTDGSSTGSSASGAGAPSLGLDIDTNVISIDSDTASGGAFIGRSDGSYFVGREYGLTPTAETVGATSSQTATSSSRSSTRSSTRSSSRTSSGRSSTSSSRNSQGASSSGRLISRPLASLAAEEESFVLDRTTSRAVAFQTTLQRRLEKYSITQQHPVPVSVEWVPSATGLTVSLSGVVKSPKDRNLLEQLVLLEPGVQAVRNNIVVQSEQTMPQHWDLQPVRPLPSKFPQRSDRLTTAPQWHSAPLPPPQPDPAAPTSVDTKRE